MRYPFLEKLIRITPSRDGLLEYYPCRVKLKNGEQFDRVIFAEEETYLNKWSNYPKGDSSKHFISIDLVSDLEESPYRLPASLANKMYESGESGMGYCIFTLVMKNGEKLPYVTGNIVDFPNLQQNYNYVDTVDLLPHIGREFLQDNEHHWLEKPYTNSADFKRCIFKK